MTLLNNVNIQSNAKYADMALNALQNRIFVPLIQCYQVSKPWSSRGKKWKVVLTLCSHCKCFWWPPSTPQFRHLALQQQVRPESNRDRVRRNPQPKVGVQNRTGRWRKCNEPRHTSLVCLLSFFIAGDRRQVDVPGAEEDGGRQAEAWRRWAARPAAHRVGGGWEPGTAAEIGEAAAGRLWERDRDGRWAGIGSVRKWATSPRGLAAHYLYVSFGASRLCRSAFLLIYI